MNSNLIYLLKNNRYEQLKTAVDININEYLIEYIHSIADSSFVNILDYGCGLGRCIKEYLNTNKQGKYYIYDSEELAINYCKQQYNGFYTYDLEKNKDIKFDNIICHRVLHSNIEDYIEQIEFLKNKLKRGGSIFLSVRSTECPEYAIVKNYCINNTFLGNKKNIKFFTMPELIDICYILNINVINHGSFIEKSSFMKKNNHYYYVVGQRI